MPFISIISHTDCTSFAREKCKLKKDLGTRKEVTKFPFFVITVFHDLQEFFTAFVFLLSTLTFKQTE